MIHKLRFSALLSLAILSGLGVAGSVSADDWRRFRGPNGSGVSSDKNVPIEISADKNLLWKVAIPGAGNSSPIVADGKIFLQSASEDGSERRIVCLDLNDGRTIWHRSAPGTDVKVHQKNTLASCTAAVGNGRVFMPFWDGRHLSLAAYDLDGKSLWNVDLGTFEAQHGAGHSPIVVGDLVILANDQDGTSEIVAFHAEDGGVAWRKGRPPFKACYSTPLVLDEPGAEPELVVASTAGVTGYDPRSGSEKWNWPWSTNDKSLRTVGSPIVSQGMVFFTGGNGPGDRHAVAVRLDDRAGELPASQLAWETRKVFPYVPCLLAQGEHLYFVNDAGIAGSYVARTGKKIWEERLGIGDVTASPLLIDGRVYVVSEIGSIRVFAAETVFKKLSEGELDEAVRATPAVADGRLLIRGKEHLFCFGKK
ncbi:MAG: hypothetical protein EXS05_08015 [Planctomycetaceae bacterium]|nr:hypothetical protein [Planctomycetaceae bacterium]